jgi:eukaryotic-like serine/threonine-protein kinase
MGISDPYPPSDGPVAAFLSVLKRSYALPEGKLDEVRSKVVSGEYPRPPVALAQRLVVDGLLTSYQVERLLRNKPQNLLVGRYVILDRIGLGSMGRVYKARHLLMDRIVALKVIAPEYVASARKVARFQREIRLIGRLDHPNVVRAYDADRVSNVPYIVMEYVQGENLSQRLQERGPLPPEEVAGFAAQAAQGLGHAHEQGVVHRDVKPSNLLVARDRQLKVLDFGLGVLMEHDEDDAEVFRTNDGIAVGTIDFMSPEQTCGHEIDGRSDLYSLGCAMYHLMTRRLLFPGSSTIERLAQRAKGERISIAERHPEFPPRLVRVMEKMLAPRPEDRFQTAWEAADALWDLVPRSQRALALGGPSNRINSRSASNGSASSQVGANATPTSSTEQPAAAAAPPNGAGAPLPPLFRFLLFLAQQSFTSILLGTLAVTFVIFSAGFGLALLVQ